MRRFKWSWLLALVVCLGGLCVAHHGQIALVPPSPSPRPQPATTNVMATMTAVPTRMTSASVPTRVATHTPGVTQMPRATNPVTLTIVYDNLPLDTRLKTAWGFACLVETGQATVLFDTGGDGPTLMGNLAALGFDPRRIDAVVLSHIHDDHTGGLDALLNVNDRLTVLCAAFVPGRVQDAREPARARHPGARADDDHRSHSHDGRTRYSHRRAIAHRRDRQRIDRDDGLCASWHRRDRATGQSIR